MEVSIIMPKIKTKGKGNKKRWIVRYDGEKDPQTGQRKQLQKSFKSSKEAEEFNAQITLNRGFQRDVSSPREISHSNEQDQVQISFEDYARQWFEVDYYQRVRASTFKSRRFYLEKHIIPFFGEKQLSLITSDDIKEFYGKKKREKYASKTISTIHKFLSTLFYSAVEDGYLVEHPMNKMEKSKPKDPIRIAHPWSYKEMTQFIKVAEQEGKDVMFDFDLSTGLRQGELLALPWFDLDLERKTVTVTRSVSYDEDGTPELIPKSQESYRTLSIPDYLVKKLKVHKEKQDEMKKRFGDDYQYELDLIFPVSHGGFQNPSNVRRLFYGLTKKAKLRRITFHDLRHTHASLLIRSGASPTIVQKRLGHEDIETTFRYYGHLWPNADQEAVQQLEKEMEKYKHQDNN